MIVERVRTPIELAELPELVAAGYSAAFPSVVQGPACPDLTRRIAIAQLIAEHGRKDHNPAGPLWGLFNNNFGNQDAAAADQLPTPEDSDVALFRTVPECEGTACQRRVQHVRRAFDTAEEGLEAYWLRFDAAYPEALAGMRAGTVEAVVNGLAQRHYFTASPAAYLALMHALVHEAERKGW